MTNQSFWTRWKKVSLPNKLTVVCTFIISLATVFYAFVACRQWFVMEEQLKEIKASSNDTKTLAEAAKKQADVTFLQLEQMRSIVGAAEKSNVLSAESLRARIERRDTQIIKPILIGDNITIASYFENTGHSPAFDVRVGVDVRRWSAMPDGKMSVTLPDHGETLDPGAPGHWAYMLDREATTREFIDELPTSFRDTAHVTAYFFGRFEYLTLGKKHHTEFCFYLVKAETLSLPFTPQLVEKHFTPMQCPKWHTAD